MNDLVLTIRIVLVRVGVRVRAPPAAPVAGRARDRPRPAARRQPGGHRGRPGGAPSRDPGRDPRPPAGRRAAAAGSPRPGTRSSPATTWRPRGCSSWTTTSSRSTSIRKRPGTTIVQTWHACGAFKKVGYSVLDKSFGVDEALASRVRIHSNYDVCLVASQTAAPHYAEAFRQPLERFRSDLGIPRTDVLFGEEHLARTRAAVRERYGLTDGRRVILYAPTFRGDSVTDARATDDLDLAGPARRPRRRPRPARPAAPVHPVRHADRPGPRGLRDRRLGSPRHQRADARERRARDRLLERDLRVRPAATGRWSSSRRTTRRTSASAASTSTTGPACPARSSRRPRRWPRTCGPASSISSAWSDFARASFDVADGGSSTRVTEALIVPSLTRAGDRR